MRPLDEAPEAFWRGVLGVASDFDDTLSTHGQGLLPETVAAMHRLAAAGVPLVIATGRPLGWAEVLMKTLPVRAAVAENGAAALLWEGGRLVASFTEADDAVRARDMAAVRAAVARVKAHLPMLNEVVDYTRRETDVALDIGEAVTVPEAIVAEARAMLEADGCAAVASTVHLHASRYRADKPAGLRRVLARLGLDPEALSTRWIYLGDSPNDAAAFAAIDRSVGVANVARWVGRIDALPRYVAPHEGGRGFVDVVSKLLAERGAL